MNRRQIAGLLALAGALPGCGGDGGGGGAGGDAGGHDRPSPAVTLAPACERATLIGTMTNARVSAHVRPDPGSPIVASFNRVNPQGATQVFPLIGRATRSDDVWYRAMLPIRPNGSSAWMLARSLEIGRTPYRIEIDLARFRLRVFEGCRVRETFAIGIGTQDTPTPIGSFFLNSLLRPPERGSVYGAFAFGLSAYSDVITDWEGGGIVGLHGTNDPSSIGHESSHGCIRMTNDAIRLLARTVPLGTPVEIS